MFLQLFDFVQCPGHGLQVLGVSYPFLVFLEQLKFIGQFSQHFVLYLLKFELLLLLGFGLRDRLILLTGDNNHLIEFGLCRGCFGVLLGDTQHLLWIIILRNKNLWVPQYQAVLFYCIFNAVFVGVLNADDAFLNQIAVDLDLSEFLELGQHLVLVKLPRNILYVDFVLLLVSIIIAIVIVVGVTVAAIIGVVAVVDCVGVSSVVFVVSVVPKFIILQIALGYLV